MNTFLSIKGSPTRLPKEVIRATEDEKEAQIATVENLRTAYTDEAAKAIKDLQQAAIRNENMFEVLMEATKYCSLGQLTAAMFEVGGAVSQEDVRHPEATVQQHRPSTRKCLEVVRLNRCQWCTAGQEVRQGSRRCRTHPVSAFQAGSIIKRSLK